MKQDLFEKELTNLKTFFSNTFYPLDTKSKFVFEKNKKGLYNVKFSSQKEKRQLKDLECKKENIFQIFSCISEAFPEILGKDDL